MFQVNSRLTQDSEVYFIQPSLLDGESLGAIHTSVKQKIVYFSTHAVNHGINPVNLDIMIDNSYSVQICCEKVKYTR